MDKDKIIFKHLEENIKDKEKELKHITYLNEKNNKKIDDLQNRIDKLRCLVNKNSINRDCILDKENKKTNNESYEMKTTITNNTFTQQEQSYEDLFEESCYNLKRKGINIENIEWEDFLSEKELKDIMKNLNRPLEKKIKWNKSDFIAVFIAASIGSLADFLLSDRNNEFTGKNSNFSRKLNTFHNHEGGSPIDYQGEGFGGGFHRGLSKSHDVLRFIEAINMIRMGRFEGIRFNDGVAYKIVSTVNQYGTPYETCNMIEAIIKYAKHMFSDLFSTCSLPFPGSSFLIEANNRDIRVFTATMYKQGFNIKNIMTQSLSVIIVEIIIRVYFALQNIKEYKDKIQVEEDYSNIEILNTIIKPVNKEKLYEMLLLSHGIVSGINIGKIIINKKPWEINIGEIISVVRYAIPVINDLISRNSEYAKISRNSMDIREVWNDLEKRCTADTKVFKFPNRTINI